MFGGGGNMDPRRMQQMMEQMGIDMDELDIEEIRMETTDGETLVFDGSSTTVNRINAQGQEMYQVVGEPTEQVTNDTTDASTSTEDDDSDDEAVFTEEDVDLVAEEASVTDAVAREALEETGGDIAAAIMQLQ